MTHSLHRLQSQDALPVIDPQRLQETFDQSDRGQKGFAPRAAARMHLQMCIDRGINGQLGRKRCIWPQVSDCDWLPNRSLDLDESWSAIEALSISVSRQDHEMLFQYVDQEQGSGMLSQQQFAKFVSLCSADQGSKVTHNVVDFIPLSEIASINVNVVKKADQPSAKLRTRKTAAMTATKTSATDAGQNQTQQSAEAEGSKGVFKRAMDFLETLTGLDLDGDGKATNSSMPEIPPYSLETQEVHMVLHTMQFGHNSGKVYYIVYILVREHIL